MSQHWFEIVFTTMGLRYIIYDNESLQSSGIKRSVRRIKTPINSISTMYMTVKLYFLLERLNLGCTRENLCFD